MEGVKAYGDKMIYEISYADETADWSKLLIRQKWSIEIDTEKTKNMVVTGKAQEAASIKYRDDRIKEVAEQIMLMSGVALGRQMML